MVTTLQPADSATAAELDAILHGAAIAPLDDIGWIRVTGSDRVRWLNGMVTNNIAALKPGQGCYNFVLNAQGRIQGDLTAFLLEDSILLETTRDQLPALLAHLDHFVIMDDVELADITDQRQGLLVAGPKAAQVVAAIDISSEDDLEPLELVHVSWHSARIDRINAHRPLVAMFEVWGDVATLSIVREQLMIAGATTASPTAIEVLRILSGTPRYGVDIRNTEKAHDLPQETGQTRALHFSKGCYLGQEIVERIRSRGNVHRTFHGFQLTGELPAAGAALMAGGKPVGELTSVASIPLPGSTVQLALGYIRREALDRNLTVEYPGGIATPITLPYLIS